MIKSYIAAIAAKGGRLPKGFRDDPAAMQIAKLDDALRKASVSTS